MLPRLLYRATLLIAALAIAGGSVSAADTTPSSSQALLQAGAAEYSQGHYQAALTDFQAGRRLGGEPGFLFSIGQCYRKLGQPAQAASFFREYLAAAPATPHRKEIEALIAQMDAASPKPSPAPGSGSPQLALRPSGAGASDASRPALRLTASAPPAHSSVVKKSWFWAAVVGGAAVVATAVALGVVYGTAPANPVATVGRVSGN